MPISNHGVQQTKLVRDTNNGIVQPSRQQASRSVGQTPQMGGYQDPDAGVESTKASGFDQMFGIADPVINDMVERDTAERMADAYNTGKQEDALKLARDSQGELSTKLFGPSPEVRGIQQRILEDEVQKDYTRTLTDIRNGHYNDHTEEAFVDAMNIQLSDMLEKYEDDPEMQKILIEAHEKNIGKVSPYQSIGHEAWKQETSAQLYKERIQDSGKHAKNYPEDPDFMNAFLADFEQTGEMTDEAWQVHATEAMVGAILEGVPNAYGAFQQEGMYGKLNGDNRKMVDQAHGQQTLNNETDGLQLKTDLNRAIRTGDIASIQEIGDEMNHLLPGSVDTHQAIMQGQQVQDEIAENKRKAGESRNRALTGMGASGEDLDNALEHMALSYRDFKIMNMDAPQNLKDDMMAAELNATDVSQFMFENPNEVAELVRMNQGVVSTHMKRTMSEGIAALTSTSKIDKDTPEGQKRLATAERTLGFYEQILGVSQSAAGYLAGSAENGEILDDLLKAQRAGEDLTFAIHEIQDNLGIDHGVVDINSEDYKKLEDQAMADFTSEFGDRRWKNLWMKSVKNEPQFRAQFQKEYIDAHARLGPEGANIRAYDAIFRNGTSIAGHAHMSLKEADDHIKSVTDGGTVEQYLETVTSDPEANRILKEYGFDTLDDPEIKYDVIGDEIIMYLPARSQSWWEWATGQVGTKGLKPTKARGVPIQLPKTTAQYKGLTEQAHAKWERDNRPSSIIRERYGYQ